jgi:hypothetical protein
MARPARRATVLASPSRMATKDGGPRGSKPMTATIETLNAALNRREVDHRE